jgi:hypothetical protein
LIAEDRIPYFKPTPGKVLIDLADLDRYVAARRIDAAS